MFESAASLTGERLKITQGIASILEELAEAELVVGKQLGKQTSNASQSSLLPAYASIWDGIHKMNFRTASTNHANLAHTLNHNICKLFPDHSKLAKKKLQNLVSKISGTLDSHLLYLYRHT